MILISLVFVVSCAGNPVKAKKATGEQASALDFHSEESKQAKNLDYVNEIGNQPWNQRFELR